MRALIERLELQESEVYVDDKGWAHDDEGNKWKVSAGAPQGVYKGTTFRSGRSYKAWRGTGQGVAAPADKGSDYLARVKGLLQAMPDNRFLLSLRSQLVGGRSLSPKQVAALEKFEKPRSRTLEAPKAAADPAEKAKPATVATPKDPPSMAAAGVDSRARSPDAAGTNERLSALDELLQKKPGDRFIQSLRDQVNRGRPLSDKQKTALRQNFHRARMSDRAKLFEHVYIC